MKSKRVISIISAIMIFAAGLTALPASAEGESGAPYNASPGAPTGLLTNELENPLNVEEPTFGWIVNDGGENVVQTAYRIVMTDEVTGDTVWDSGKVASSEQSYVPFDEGQGSNGNDGYKANFISYGGLSYQRIGSVGIWRNEDLGALTMIKAAYDSTGNLVSIVCDSVPSGESGTLATAFSGATLDDPDISLDIPQGGSIKVFLWEGETIGSKMEPAAFPLEIQTNGTQFIDNLDEINFAPLEDAHPYSWKVKTWTKAGNAAEVESDYSESAYFATGVTDWDGAKWISDGTGGASANEGTYNHFWYVRKSDMLDSSKTVKKATAYISGLQDYDLYVNDSEIGRGQSFDYASESRYQGWDITNAVKSVNDTITIGALVRTYGGGQGRAAVNAGFLGYINVFYTDGTVKTIKTDNTWKVSKSVPFSGTTKRNGEGDFVENYNASNAQDGFTLTSFDDSAWTAASDRTVDEEITKPIAELSKPTAELVKPVEVYTVNGTTIADFGVVIPARPVITFKNGTAGTSVTITGGYTLKSDKTVATGDKPQQSTDMTWKYTQKAGGQTYHAWDHLGFRYLQIPSCGETFTADTIQAEIFHTNVPEGRQSTFVTSNETLNNVYTLMQRSSLYGIQNEFVDTPTREKGQFTDDSRNISEASMATQFEREASRKGIMQFLASADRYWTTDGVLDGRYNSVYPNVDGKRDIPEYSVNMPQWIWNYYMQTGDKATLKYAYPYMLATANYISDNINETTGLVTQLAGGSGGYQYGIVDWPASGRFGYDWDGTKNGARTTVNMLSKHAFDVVALAAEELAADMGNDREMAKIDYDVIDMGERSRKLKDAINSQLRNNDGLYVDGTNGSSKVTHVSQHANSFALAFDIVPDENKDTVAEYIAGMGMRQGPMTADILAKGLFNGGQDTAALKLFINENDYGWAKTLKQGGSFTWESWVADGSSVNDSQSHAWGATAASDILRNFAGVQILEAGAKKVKIAPVYVDLTSLDATVQTERGGVGVSYTRTEPTEENPEIENSYSITITIPANMTADVELPDIGTGTYKVGSKTGAAVENSFTLGSGTYTYVFDGEITPPEKIDTKLYDEETYDFKTLPSTATGDYKYNDYITLHFGANGAVSENDGFNMYKDSTDNAYLIFTPAADGTVELTGKVRNNASTLYVTENESSAKSASATGATQLRSAGKDSATTGMGSMKVEAGKTYYFYNTGGTSSANPTSITTFTYTHEHIPVTGIKGNDNTENKTYTWTIGNGEVGNTYSDTSDIIDLTVSLGEGDSMNETDGTIRFSSSSVGESGSANDTKRYLLITPKKSGTFSIDIAFDTASGSTKNRIYYRDFADEADLTTCVKSGTQLAGDFTSTSVGTRTLEMQAEHTYVLYTYQKPSKISAMSYTYTDTEIEVTPDGLDKKYMHISFDDVYACLKDITDNAPTYDSVFDNGFFNDLKSLHETYGAVFTLNCFIKTTKNSGYDISNLPDKYASELAENDDWLKFAFHAQDDKAIYGETTGTSSGTLATVSETKASYKKFTDAIMKATDNNISSIDTVTRLGFFSGNEENIAALSEADYGITGLLTADDSRLSYYFDNALNSHVNKYGYHYDSDKELKLIKTITRLEGNKEVSSFSTAALDSFGGNMIEVFTHESEYLDKAAVKTNLENAVKWAYDKNYGFGYAMDLILPPDEQPEIVPNVTYEAPDATKTVTEPSGTSITLDHNTYPLVVGNASATDFTDWEARGSSFTLTATVDSNDYTASNITWSVDDEDIAYIRDNKTSGASTSIRGMRTGTTRAVAALPNGDKAVCYITVIDNVTRVTVNALELNADTLELHTGDGARLIPIINPKDVYGNGVLDTTIGWASEDNDVVTVNNGVITAVAPGTAKIMAKSNDVGRRAYCTVTVTNETASAGTDSTEEITAMTVGQTAQLTATGTNLTWRSDNPAVADVDSTGKVTAYSNSNVPHVDSETKTTVFENGITKYDEGSVNIYATAQDGSVTTFPVKVREAEKKAESVSIYMADTNVAVGGTADITAAVLPAYAFGKDVTWSSSNPSVASVDDGGKTVYGVPKATITGIAAGTATITASCDGETDTVEITVTTQKDEVSVTTGDVKYQMEVDAVYDRLFTVTPKANSGITFESSDPSVVTVDNEGVIRGAKAGTATITAKLGDTVKATREVEVIENDPTIRYLHAPAEARTDTSVNLLWTRASLLDTGDFASYSIYKSTDGITYDATPVATGITTLGYTVEALEPDTQYHFKVVSVDSKGDEIAHSTTVVRTKAASTVINVMDKGAAGDGIHMDTYAIQKAIDEAGYGDTILLPEGKIFLSGALYLKSNITFKVDGILLGSPYDKDYPATITRWEGWRRLYQNASEWGANSGTDGLTENVHPHASLINAGTYDEGTPSYTGAYNIENLTICGKGMINANGFRLGYNEGLNQKSPQPEPMTPAKNQTVRGRAITLHNADKVYIKDVTVSYSPSWTIHPIFCRSLTVDGVNVVSAGDGKTGAADDITILNGDGIDPDSSTMVNLFNMDFQTGDDGVAIKTGKDKEGNVLNKPCAYIRVTDCYSHDSKGGIVIGSENASGTHDTLIQNIKVGSTTLKHTIWLKGCWSRGGVTHDLVIRDIDGVDKFDIQTTYNTPTNNPADTVPQYKNITFENCNVSFTAKGFNHSISGLSALAKTRPETYLESFTIRGCPKGGSVDYAKNFTIIDPEKESNWSFGSHTENMSFVYSGSETSTKLKVKSDATHVSSIDNDNLTITTATGTLESELLADIESLIPDLTLGYSLSADGKTLTVTAEDGTTTANYTVSYAAIWDFSKYTTEVKLTTDGVAEADYNGLEISLAGNGADSDHDKITTDGVYWRGGASNGDSVRYIKYTPTENGTITVTGKLNGSGGRLGISTSKDVNSLAADGSSTTSTSVTTFQKECVANTTYYIIPKGKSATVSTISFTPAK